MNGKIRIVIIDDDEKLTEKLVKDINEQPDMEVVATKTNGLDAVNLIKRNKPNVVLLDDVMPHIDGIGVLERINSTVMYNKPLFIFLSSLGTEKLLKRFLNLGASYCFVKPFNNISVIERIREFTETEKPEKIDREEYIKPPKNSFINTYENAKIQYLEKKNRKENLDIMVSLLIHELGVPAHILGYQYIKESIILTVNDFNMIRNVTTVLYPAVAQKYNTTASRVERSIRHGIEVAFGRGNSDLMQSIFGYTISTYKGKPTNSEFISMIAEKIKTEIRKR